MHAQGTDLHDCEVAGQVDREPGMLPDFWDGDPLESMHDKHAADQVTGSWCEVVRERVHALLDLLEKIRNILIVEWERTTE